MHFWNSFTDANEMTMVSSSAIQNLCIGIMTYYPFHRIRGSTDAPVGERLYEKNLLGIHVKGGFIGDPTNG